MKKYPLIGISIVAAVLLFLVSFNNIVGFQTVQASKQKIINNEVNPKDLLFKTIIDMANNKEIQKVILGSEIIGKRIIRPEMKFSVFISPVLTEKFLKWAYKMGVILTKTFSQTKMHSMMQQYQVSNQKVQKEMTAVVENDAALNGEMTKLSSLSCDCENENTTIWHFPIICLILFPIETFIDILYYFSGVLFHYIPQWLQNCVNILKNIDTTLNCL
jgi:hypothetical protein